MNKKGFTLIELLIVVLVIGALSGILLGVVNTTGVRAKARDAQRKADLKRIQTALELYFADNRAYPDHGSSWVLAQSIAGTPAFTGYMDTIPQDPTQTADSSDSGGVCSTEDSFGYYYSGAGGSYSLVANMEIPTSAEDSPCVGCTANTGTCYEVNNP